MEVICHLCGWHYDEEQGHDKNKCVQVIQAQTMSLEDVLRETRIKLDEAQRLQKLANNTYDK